MPLIIWVTTLIDETRDESKMEQMTIILRFIDKYSFIRDRFFDIVHVEDTTDLTLKNEIYNFISCCKLQIKNIQG
jgi:hypothetical protein